MVMKDRVLSVKQLAEKYREAAIKVLQDKNIYDKEDVVNAVAVLLLDPEVLEAALEKIAEARGGCLACSHGVPPWLAVYDLKVRDCSLGFNPEERDWGKKCDKWVKLK